MSAWLEDCKGRRFEIRDRCIIGRMGHNDIVVDDSRVSRWHALIQRVGPMGHCLVDFGSRNGLYLNGRRLNEPGLLKDGDEILVGESLFRFRQTDQIRSARRAGAALDEPTERAADAYAATAHGVVLLGEDGQARFMTRQSRKWLEDYFGEADSEGKLPSRLREWLAECRSGQPVRVMTLRRGDKRLLVRRTEDEQLLLLIEEESVFAPAMVQALGLTAREGEVLRWVAEGKTTSQIATILDASPRTVEKHMQHIFDKLGVDSRAAAVLRAIDLIKRSR